MSAIKIIICSTIGAFLALNINMMMFTHNLGVQQLFTSFAEKAKDTTTKNVVTPNTLNPKGINFTIKNGTTHKLTCVKQIEGKTVTFLKLNQYETKDYENIVENEYIGCSLDIDESRASTVLTWFNVKGENYTMRLEKVPCKTCKEITERWGTVVVTENGEVLPQSF